MAKPVQKNTFFNKEARRRMYNDAWNDFRERVREAYSVERAVEELSNVRLDGRPGQRVRKACCPFHPEKTPSFSVSNEKNSFQCFGGSCGVKGGVFDFIMEYQGVTLTEAVLIAADRVGISPPDGTSAIAPKRSASRKPSPQVTISYENPAKMQKCDLISIPENIPHPKPNHWLNVWHEERSKNAPSKQKNYLAKDVHEYRTVDGDLIISVLRREFPDRKIFTPVRLDVLPPEAPRSLLVIPETGLGWVDNTGSGGMKKPIFGMEKTRDWVASGGYKILLVEGEKTANATQRLVDQFPDADKWIVLSTMGGSNAVLMADWSDFMDILAQHSPEEINVIIWPDADPVYERHGGAKYEPQKIYTTKLVGGFTVSAREAGISPDRFTFTRIQPDTDVKKGWDLADAEEEGWDGLRLIDELQARAHVTKPDKAFLEMQIDFSAEEEVGLVPFEDVADDFGDVEYTPDEEEKSSETDVKRDILAEIDAMKDPENKKSALPEVLTPEDLSPDEVTVAQSQIEENAAMERPLAAEDIMDMPDEGEVVEGEVIDPGSCGTRAGHIQRQRHIGSNPFFRCIGHRDEAYFFMSLTATRIYRIGFQSMKKTALLSLAPLYFWSEYFSKMDARGNFSIDWDLAISTLIQQCQTVGFWDPRREAGQGARIDFGRVIFNTGAQLWVQDQGYIQAEDLAIGDNKYVYTIDDPCNPPDFDNPFTASDTEPRDLLKIIRNIDWREGHENLSVLGLFGWLCIAPICGVLPWRPHLWLDGMRSSGKSWIIKNIVTPALGDFSIRIKSNSTESGIRNILHSKAIPLIFDEAEGEEEMDKNRMKSIMALARHSASPDDAIVAQGVAGGEGRRQFSIASTFLLASITPQIEKSADKTRFARARLGTGHNALQFSRKLEGPAEELLTEDFSRRMIARIVMRAGELEKISKMMVRALLTLQLERRMADVFGTFAAGAYLLLEDGVPEDSVAACAWIEETFNINEELTDFATEIEGEKDHSILFRKIKAKEVRCETLQMGARTYRIGALMNIACFPDGEGEEIIISQAYAIKTLKNLGICPGFNNKPLKSGQTADCMFIHKNSDPLVDLLINTAYRTSYADVMQQAENVKNGPVVRFDGLGTSRTIVIPIAHFDLGPGEDEDDSKGQTGSS
jgi:putative DNA primase/helicase